MAFTKGAINHAMCILNFWLKKKGLVFIRSGIQERLPSNTVFPLVSPQCLPCSEQRPPERLECVHDCQDSAHGRHGHATLSEVRVPASLWQLPAFLSVTRDLSRVQKCEGAQWELRSRPAVGGRGRALSTLLVFMRGVRCRRRCTRRWKWPRKDGRGEVAKRATAESGKPGRFSWSCPAEASELPCPWRPGGDVCPGARARNACPE